jgi:hypothetical protein
MYRCLCEVNGKQCKLKRKYPVNNPKFCHIHIQKCAKELSKRESSSRISPSSPINHIKNLNESPIEHSSKPDSPNR